MWNYYYWIVLIEYDSQLWVTHVQLYVLWNQKIENPGRVPKFWHSAIHHLINKEVKLKCTSLNTQRPTRSEDIRPLLLDAPEKRSNQHSQICVPVNELQLQNLIQPNSLWSCTSFDEQPGVREAVPKRNLRWARTMKICIETCDVIHIFILFLSHCWRR